MGLTRDPGRSSPEAEVGKKEGVRGRRGRGSQEAPVGEVAAGAMGGSLLKPDTFQPIRRGQRCGTSWEPTRRRGEGTERTRVPRVRRKRELDNWRNAAEARTTAPGSTQQEAKQMPALIHNESTVVLWKISTDSPGKSQRMRRRGPLLVTLLQARDTGRFLPPRRVYSDHAVDASCLLMMMLSLNLTLFHGAGGNSAGGTGREDREPRPRSLHNCPTAGSCFPLLSLTAARLPSAAGLD